jgi:hypothetical protein
MAATGPGPLSPPALPRQTPRPLRRPRAAFLPRHTSRAPPGLSTHPPPVKVPRSCARLGPPQSPARLNSLKAHPGSNSPEAPPHQGAPELRPAQPLKSTSRLRLQLPAGRARTGALSRPHPTSLPSLPEEALSARAPRARALRRASRARHQGPAPGKVRIRAYRQALAGRPDTPQARPGKARPGPPPGAAGAWPARG